MDSLHVTNEETSIIVSNQTIISTNNQTIEEQKSSSPILFSTSSHDDVTTFTNCLPPLVKNIHQFFNDVPKHTTNHDEPKPNYSYIGLISMAILSTKEKKMVLSDIYQWIQDHYSYFQSRGPGWRNSIRHNLSLNDCFVKVGRSSNGKGHFWAIHPANLEDFKRGDFRRRRAQRKVRRSMGLACPDDDDTPSPSPATSPKFTVSSLTHCSSSYWGGPPRQMHTVAPPPHSPVGPPRFNMFPSFKHNLFLPPPPPSASFFKQHPFLTRSTQFLHPHHTINKQHFMQQSIQGKQRSFDIDNLLSSPLSNNSDKLSHLLFPFPTSAGMQPPQGLIQHPLNLMQNLHMMKIMYFLRQHKVNQQHHITSTQITSPTISDTQHDDEEDDREHDDFDDIDNDVNVKDVINCEDTC